MIEFLLGKAVPSTKTNGKASAAANDMVNAQLEISKFKRELLIKIHKEGEFSDAAIKKVEREMDIDELKLELKVPKEDNH